MLVTIGTKKVKGGADWGHIPSLHPNFCVCATSVELYFSVG